MKPETKHTPTPWKVGGMMPDKVYQSETGWLVAECTSSYHGCDTQEANAAFIVRAVNAYYSDQELIKDLISKRRLWRAGLSR